jgi:Fe-S-cluster containining protein
VETVFKEVNFQCQRCGACCHHKRPAEFDDLVPIERLAEFVEKSNLIYLTGEDIDKISRAAERRPEEFVDTLYPYDGSSVKIEEDGRSVVLDLPVLKSKADATCVFYQSPRGCAVYSVRPKACRLFPFRVDEETMAKGDVLLRIGYNSTCPGIGRGRPVDRKRLKILVAEQFMIRNRELASEVQRLKAMGLISDHPEIYRTMPGCRRPTNSNSSK